MFRKVTISAGGVNASVGVRWFSKMSPACHRAGFDEIRFFGFDGVVGNDSDRRILRRWHLFASAFLLVWAKPLEFWLEIRPVIPKSLK
jgi:hypothetical protein